MKTQKTDTLYIITSEPGFTLTQVSVVEPIDRILSKVIYLGKNDIPENYMEIPDSEALILEEEIKKILENPEKQE